MMIIANNGNHDRSVMFERIKSVFKQAVIRLSRLAIKTIVENNSSVEDIIMISSQIWDIATVVISARNIIIDELKRSNVVLIISEKINDPFFNDITTEIRYLPIYVKPENVEAFIPTIMGDYIPDCIMVVTSPAVSEIDAIGLAEDFRKRFDTSIVVLSNLLHLPDDDKDDIEFMKRDPEKIIEKLFEIRLRKEQS